MDVRPILAWLLVIAGMIVCAGGLVWILTPTIPWLGRLPGDIKIKKEKISISTSLSRPPLCYV